MEDKFCANCERKLSTRNSKAEYCSARTCQLLQAVCGPNNYIRELQATRNDPNNPINILLEEYIKPKEK